MERDRRICRRQTSGQRLLVLHCRSEIPEIAVPALLSFSPPRGDSDLLIRIYLFPPRVTLHSWSVTSHAQPYSASLRKAGRATRSSGSHALRLVWQLKGDIKRRQSSCKRTILPHGSEKAGSKVCHIGVWWTVAKRADCSGGKQASRLDASRWNGKYPRLIFSKMGGCFIRDIYHRLINLYDAQRLLP